MADDTDPKSGSTVAPEPKPKTETTPAEPPKDGEPGWLKGRLEQAKTSAERAVLEQLGISGADIEQAKAAIAAAKAAEEAKKTSDQRAAEADAKAAAALTRATALETQTKELAARMLVTLSEDQRKDVAEIAGDDPALQIRAIQTLAKTWSAAAAASTQKPKETPATTAPPPNAPGGTDPQSPPDHRAVYDSLKTNPFARAAYGLAHPEAYQPRK